MIKKIINVPWLILFLYSKTSIQNSFVQRTMMNIYRKESAPLFQNARM